MVRLLALVIVTIPFQNAASTNLDNYWGYWVSDAFPDKVSCRAIEDMIVDGDKYNDGVNTSSRIKSKGRMGKENICRDAYELVSNESQFTIVNCGKVEVKGKREMQMWFVSNA